MGCYAMQSFMLLEYLYEMRVKYEIKEILTENGLRVYIFLYSGKSEIYMYTTQKPNL